MELRPLSLWPKIESGIVGKLEERSIPGAQPKKRIVVHISGRAGRKSQWLDRLP